MVRNSSTSSSEHDYLADGRPVGLAVAIVLILLVEIVVRRIGHDRMLPYAPGAIAFESAALHIRNADRVGDVCFIGSSRGRESVHLPTVAKTLHQEFDRHLTAANFSNAAARASEMLPFVRALLKRHRPRLIVYVLGPRSLLGSFGPSSQTAFFLDGADLFAKNDRQKAAWREWPIIARTEIGRVYQTLAYRARLPVTLRRAAATLRGDDLGQELAGIVSLQPIPSPIRGDATTWHTRDAGVSLLTRPVSDERVRRYVERLLVDGQYPLAEEQLTAVSELIELCQEQGVGVILAEVPVSTILRDHWPAGTEATFRRMMEELAGWLEVPFVTVDQLGLSLDAIDFLEQSHLNLAGAEKFSSALTRIAIAPRLRSSEGGEARPQQVSGGNQPSE